MDLLKWLLIPALVLFAWKSSGYSSALARNVARQASALLAALVVAIAITGFFHVEEPSAFIHRWGGHALVIAVWLFVPFASGVLFQQQVQQRPVAAIAQTLCLLALFGFTFLSATTGYLGPTHQEFIYADSQNRFVLMHFYVLPVLVVGILSCCYWFLLPRRV